MGPVTASKPFWAIEVFRDNGPSEFYAVNALVARDEHVIVRVKGGDELRFERNDIRKIIIIRTNEKSS